MSGICVVFRPLRPCAVVRLCVNLFKGPTQQPPPPPSHQYTINHMVDLLCIFYEIWFHTEKTYASSQLYHKVSFLFFNIIFWCMYKSKYHLNLPMNNKCLLVWLHSCSCGSLIGSWSASPEPSWPIWPYSIACERPTSWHQYRSTLSPTTQRNDPKRHGVRILEFNKYKFIKHNHLIYLDLSDNCPV